MRTLLALTLVLGMSCASSLTRQSAQRYAELGQKYAQAGDFEQSALAYGQSIQRAEHAGVEDPTMALLLYEYGRAAALSGDLDEGCSAFDDALAKLQGATDDRSKSLRIATRATMARALFDNARFDRAIAHYDRLTQEVDPRSLGASDAPDWVAMLEEATEAAQRTGDAESARRFRATVESIRAAHDSLPSPTPYLRFTPEAVAARKSS